MEFKYGNAIAAVQAESGYNTLSCFRRIGIQLSATTGTISKIYKNDVVNQTFLTEVGGGVGADPTALVGLTAVNGVATTLMRSDAAPALSQAISPTMTGRWIFAPSSDVTAVTVRGYSTPTANAFVVSNSGSTEHYIRTSSAGQTGFGFLSTSAAPAASVHAVGEGAVNAMQFDAYGTSTTGGLIQRRSLGTRAAPLAISGTGYVLGGIYAKGAISASAFGANPNGSIEFVSHEAFGAGNQGTYFQMHTTADGTNVRVPRLTISPDGKVGIGLDTSTAPFGTLSSIQLHVIDTAGNQFRVGRDASNYWQTNVSTIGAVTFDAVGSGPTSFSFLDTVNITGGLAVSGTITSGGNGVVLGTGTTNTLPKWTAANTLGDSVATDDGTNFTIATAASGVNVGATVQIAGAGTNYGGAITILGGSSPFVTTGIGGGLDVICGDGYLTPGNINLYAGGVQNVGAGGSVVLQGGLGGLSNGAGGAVNIFAGSASAGSSAGGTVSFKAGAATGGGTNGTFLFMLDGLFQAELFFSSLTSANRVFTFPNATGTLPLLSLAQTWTAVQTFTPQTIHNGGIRCAGTLDMSSFNIATNTGTGTKIGTATNQLIGIWNHAPAAQPAAFTQTYSTATHTHSNPTASAVSTTAATNIAPFGYTTQAQADAIVAAINALIVDMANVKQVVNAVIDDGQSWGALA